MQMDEYESGDLPRGGDGGALCLCTRSEPCCRCGFPGAAAAPDVPGYLDGVFYVQEMDASIAYVSSAFEPLWGRPVADAHAHGALALLGVHPGDRFQVEVLYRASLEGVPFDADYRIVRPDGEVRWIHHRAQPVRDREGDVLRILGFVEDVTARHAVEVGDEPLPDCELPGR